MGLWIDRILFPILSGSMAYGVYFIWQSNLNELATKMLRSTNFEAGMIIWALILFTTIGGSWMSFDFARRTLRAWKKQ